MANVSLYEILNGKSRLLPEKGGVFFYRHPTLFEVDMSSEFEEKYTLRARELGLLTKEELLSSAVVDGGWSESEESEIKYHERVLGQQKRSLKNLEAVDPALADGMKMSIKNTQHEIAKLQAKKESLCRFSLEEWVTERVNRAQLELSVFSDEECNEPVRDPSELNSITMPFMEKYRALHDEETILNLCYPSPLFDLSAIYDDYSKILGKSYYDITVYQKNVLYYCKYLNMKLNNIPDIPEDVASNAVALFRYSREKKNIERDFNVREHVKSRGGEENLKPEDLLT